MLSKKDREFHQDWFLLKHTSGDFVAGLYVLAELFNSLGNCATEFDKALKFDKKKKVYFDKPKL